MRRAKRGWPCPGAQSTEKVLALRSQLCLHTHTQTVHRVTTYRRLRQVPSPVLEKHAISQRKSNTWGNSMHPSKPPKELSPGHDLAVAIAWQAQTPDQPKTAPQQQPGPSCQPRDYQPIASKNEMTYASITCAAAQFLLLVVDLLLSCSCAVLANQLGHAAASRPPALPGSTK
jgi:hypothetical protein